MLFIIPTPEQVFCMYQFLLSVKMILTCHFHLCVRKLKEAPHPGDITCEQKIAMLQGTQMEMSLSLKAKRMLLRKLQEVSMRIP